MELPFVSFMAMAQPALRGPCLVPAKMGRDVNVAVDEARKHGVAAEVDDLRPLGRLAGAEGRDFVALT